jgi:hypothetical protein
VACSGAAHMMLPTLRAFPSLCKKANHSTQHILCFACQTFAVRMRSNCGLLSGGHTRHNTFSSINLPLTLTKSQIDRPTLPFAVKTPPTCLPALPMRATLLNPSASPMTRQGASKSIQMMIQNVIASQRLMKKGRQVRYSIPKSSTS